MNELLERGLKWLQVPPKQLLLALLLIAVMVRLPSYFHDFMDSDEAVYAAVAMNAQVGLTPYYDAVERKTPLVFYLYAGVFKIFGTGNMHALHLLLTLWVLAAAWCLRRFVLELYAQAAMSMSPAPPNTEAQITAGLAALFYIAGGTYYNFEWLAANCEMLMDLPIILGFYLTLKNHQQAKFIPALLLGTLFGWAFITKQTALIPFAAALSFPLLAAIWQGGWRRRLLALVVSLVGFALVMVATYGWFAWLGHAKDFYFWSWQVNLQYVNDSFDSRYVIKKFFLYTSLFALACLPLTYLVGRYASRLRRFGLPAILVLFWFAAQFASLWLSGKFYTHYYYLLLAPMVLVASIATNELSMAGKRRAVLAVLVLALIYSSLWLFKDPLHRWYGYGTPDYAKIAEYVERNTTPEDRIFVWGYSPEIYVLSKRLNGGRFVFCDYLTGRIAGHPRVLDPSFDTTPYAVPIAWDMLWQDLDEKKPVYFIDTSPGNFHQYGKYSMHRYMPLLNYVERHYQFETDVAGAMLYRRRN